MLKTWEPKLKHVKFYNTEQIHSKVVTYYRKTSGYSMLNSSTIDKKIRKKNK